MAVIVVRNVVYKVKDFQLNSPSELNQNNEYGKKAVFAWFYQVSKELESLKAFEKKTSREI